MTINWVCIRVTISIRHKISVKRSSAGRDSGELLRRNCAGWSTRRRSLHIYDWVKILDPRQFALTFWPAPKIALDHLTVQFPSPLPSWPRMNIAVSCIFLCNKNGCELIIVVTVQPFFAICGKLSPSPTELSCKTSLHLCQTSTPSYVVDLRVALRLSLKKDFSITNCGGFPWKQTSSGS